MFRELSLNMSDLALCEAVVLSKLDRARRTIQIEGCFTASPDHVHVGRPVIVRVDYDAQSVESENCRHCLE